MSNDSNVIDLPTKHREQDIAIMMGLAVQALQHIQNELLVAAKMPDREKRERHVESMGVHGMFADLCCHVLDAVRRAEDQKSP